MDLRFPLAGLGLSLALLATGGCSPDDQHPLASLEERTAQFEQNLDTIKDQPLKDAVADLGGSLLLLMPGDPMPAYDAKFLSGVLPAGLTYEVAR